SHLPRRDAQVLGDGAVGGDAPGRHVVQDAQDVDTQAIEGIHDASPSSALGSNVVVAACDHSMAYWSANSSTRLLSAWLQRRESRSTWCPISCRRRCCR